MTLYDILCGRFSKDDWSRLGRGEIQDEDTIKQMLMEGYEAIASDE